MRNVRRSSEKWHDKYLMKDRRRRWRLTEFAQIKDLGGGLSGPATRTTRRSVAGMIIGAGVTVCEIFATSGASALAQVGQ